MDFQERRNETRRKLDASSEEVLSTMTQIVGHLGGLSHALHDLGQRFQRLQELENHQESMEDLLQSIHDTLLEIKDQTRPK